MVNHRSSPPASAETTPPKTVLRLLVLLNLGVLACVIGLLVRLTLSPTGGTSPAKDAETLKAVAEELDQRGLDGAAADAWQQYLDAAPAAPDRAELLVRIGHLRLRAEQYHEAAEALARARLAAPENTDIRKEVEAGLDACQDLLGRGGEIARLLAARRLNPPKKSESAVVAAIGDEKLTEADLDRLIQKRLVAEGAAGDKSRRPPDARQIANPVVRARLLRSIVQNDLLTRRARELKLDQDAEFAAARGILIENLLIRRLLEQEVSVPAPTEADLEAFYKAHEADFRQPESLRALVVRVDGPKAAADLLANVKSADDFRKAADEAHGPGGEPAAGLRQVFRGQPDQVLGNVEPLFAMAEGEWTRQAVSIGQNHYLVLVEKKVPARTPALPEVRQFVQQAVLEERHQAAMDKLFGDLAARYGVELLLKAPASQAGAPPGEADRTLTEIGTPRVKLGPSPPPSEKPENPLRKDAPGEKPKADAGGKKAEGG